MGQRREARKEVRVAVRIFGTDTNGRVFSENVSTTNVSRAGVRLGGVRAQIKAGEIVGLTYGQNRGRFGVKWVGQKGTPQEGQIGLQSVSPEKSIWDFPLPAAGIDPYKPQSGGAERRRHPRLKSVTSLELHPEGQAAPIWGKAVDLSVGGCFVEMPIPLKKGTKLKVGLWIKETKLWASAMVVNSRPGFGIGIQFTEVSAENTERLTQFLRSITRTPM